MNKGKFLAYAGLAAISVLSAVLFLLATGSLTPSYGQGGHGQPEAGIFSQFTATCYMPGQRPRAYDFTLVDQYNETVTLSKLWNRPVLIFFTYTYCTDICPITNALVNQTLPLIRPYFGPILDITLDPAHDNVSRLYYYSKGNRFNWLFLTGNYSYLEGVWSHYGVVRAVKGNTIFHNVAFIVVKDGEILGEAQGLASPSTLAEALINIANGKCS